MKICFFYYYYSQSWGKKTHQEGWRKSGFRFSKANKEGLGASMQMYLLKKPLQRYGYLAIR